MVTRSQCCRMFKECLGQGSMRLGVLLYPKGQESCLFFIWKALVAFCPWAHRTIQWTPDNESVWFPSLFGEADRCQPLVLGHTRQFDGALDNPVRPGTVGSVHMAAVDCAPTIGTSESRWPPSAPDSPVNFSQSTRPNVTPQVLLRVFTQAYTIEPIITCGLVWAKDTKLGGQDPK
jgi:hypothetical protein